MNATNPLNLVLWSVQVFLALFFLGAGAPKILGRAMERWTGFSEMPRNQVVFIGITEVLGALGLVLPMAAGILPWLTPLSAVGLAIIVLMAAGFHLRADERLNALETVLWASIAAVIAIGRWDLVASVAEVSPGVLVGALALLVPAAIVNVIVLLRRPVNSATPRAVPRTVLAGEPVPEFRRMVR
jgi:DoxX-like protein